MVWAAGHSNSTILSIGVAGISLEGFKNYHCPSVTQASPHHVEVDLSHNALGPFFTHGVSDGEGDHISSRLMEELLKQYAPSWFRVMVLTPTVWKLTPRAEVHEAHGGDKGIWHYYRN